MVTILEPRETLSLEPVASEPVAATELLPPEAGTPRGEPVEWRFSMPCAGVRYFSFGPAAPKERPGRHPTGPYRPNSSTKR